MDVLTRQVNSEQQSAIVEDDDGFIARRDLHRAVFLAAGLYNIVWGLVTALHPQWMYRLTGEAAANRAEVASALGLVIGLYGILYLEVARVLERGWLIAAVGLAGKVLGPAGLIFLVGTGSWPASSLLICVTNDFIWWIPFALYLYDSRRSYWREMTAQFAGKGSI